MNEDPRAKALRPIDSAEQLAVYARSIMEKDRRIKQLEIGYDELRTICNRLQAAARSGAARAAPPTPAVPDAEPVAMDRIGVWNAAEGVVDLFADYDHGSLDDGQDIFASPVVAAAPIAQEGMVCNWHQEDLDGGYYDTGCDHVFSILEGSDAVPSWMKFCCYCGKRAVVHPWKDDEDDAALAQTEGK